jgi:trimeric autotransporter adhesin
MLPNLVPVALESSNPAVLSSQPDRRASLLPLLLAILGFFGGLCPSLAVAQSNCDAPWNLELFGVGSPGSAGVPVLETDDIPLLHQPFTLRLIKALPGTVGAVFFSEVESSLFWPFFEAYTYPGFPVTIRPFVVGPDGSADPALYEPVLGSNRCGVTFIVQAYIIDPAAQGGLAFSAPLRVTPGTLKAPEAVQVLQLQQSVSVQWNAVAGADLYAVHVADQAGFVPALTTLAVEVTGTAAEVELPASSQDTLYVRVLAIKDELSGVPSTSVPIELCGNTAQPTAPVLAPYAAVTKATEVVISGTAPSASSVQITGQFGTLTVPVVGDLFASAVSLTPNAVNQLYVASLSPCGVASPPSLAEITVDLAPPTFAILSPAAGISVTAEYVTVAGNIADMLSGSQGLSIEVAGLPGSVYPGIGTNGTFVVSDVPLDVGLNVLPVIASDALGNEQMGSVEITRIAVPEGSPTLKLLAGDLQAGPVGQELAQPLAVEVRRGDGTPFAGKPVTFAVTRSDGRLASVAGAAAEDAGLLAQVYTDPNGVARVWWRLGSDAGSGNNRVQVTSADVLGSAEFCASGMAGPVARIVVSANNGQIAQAGSNVPLPVVARVLDGVNPVPGVLVTFAVVGADGLVNGQSAVTLVSDQAGLAEVQWTLGSKAGPQRLEATFPGNLGLPAGFVAEAIVPDPTQPTIYSGLVLDNGSRGIGGAECRLVVAGKSYPSVLTDQQGRFTITGIPAGAAELFVDGSLADSLGGSPILPGTFPKMHYEDFFVVAHAVNSPSMPILLPDLDPANARSYSLTDPTVLEVAGIEGLRMVIEPGSMTLPDGTPAMEGTIVSLNQVNFEQIPMPLPDGVSYPFAWTMQPGGSTFNPPVRVELPNLVAQAPGAVCYFSSFDHSTGRFEIFGTGAVTNDGSQIVSDPDSGLTLAGWGAPLPPPLPTGTVGSCETGDCDYDALWEQATAALKDADAAFGKASTILGGLIGPDGEPPIISQIAQLEGLSISYALAQALYPATVTTVAITAILCGATTATPLPLDDPLCLAAIKSVAAELAPFVAAAAATLGQAALLAVDVNDLLATAAEAIPHIASGLSLLTIAGALRAEANACCLSLQIDELEADAIDALKAKWEAVKQQLEQIPAPAQVLGTILNAFEEFVQSAADEANFWLDNLEAGNPPFDEGGCNDCKVCVIETSPGQFLTLEVPLETDCQPPWAGTLVPDPTIGLAGLAALESAAALLPQVSTLLLELQGPLTAAVQQAEEAVGLGAELGQFLSYKGWRATSGGLTVAFDTNRTYLIPNVLAGSNAKRVFITRIGADPAYYGASNLFQVIAGSTTQVANPIPISTQAPVVPVDLDIQPAGILLLLPGEQVELAIEGVLNDGSQVPLQTLTEGTGYLSSNKLIVDVNGAGIVTAGPQNGTAFVVVSNQGVTVTKKVTVVSQVIETTIAGIVQLADGTLVAGAKVTTATGEQTFADTTGAFQLQVSVPAAAGSLVVSASAPISGQNYAGSKTAKDIVGGGITDVGILVLGPAGPGPCLTPEWLPTFGKQPGVGPPPSSYVSALIVHDDGSGPALFVGGKFGGNVTKWDGQSFKPLAGGLNAEVRDFAIYDDGLGGGPALYAVGDFTTGPGSPSLNRVARWNGQSWTGLGSPAPGLIGPVHVAAVFDAGAGPVLVVGGDFTSAATTSIQASRVAAWNGQTWSALGAGVDGSVRAMAVAGPDSPLGPGLYVGGAFTSAGGAPANRIARWDGSTWSALAGGANDWVESLILMDDGTPAGLRLIAGGRFTQVDGISAARIAGWDGAGWEALGAGLDGPPASTVSVLSALNTGSGQSLFAGGNFTASGGQTMQGFAQWNGLSWSAASSASIAPTDAVLALAQIPFQTGETPSIFVGGRIAAFGNLTVNGIAAWDGVDFKNLGSGFDKAVSAQLVHDDGTGLQLVVGGEFTTAGGIAANRVAAWNGTTWSAFGAGLSGQVTCLAVYDTGSGPQIHAGGAFVKEVSPGVLARNIACWDGATWQPLGAGLDSVVFAMQAFDFGGGSELCAGGLFATTGGAPVSRVARWNGQTWSSVGAGFDQGSVRALAAFTSASGPVLVAGGDFLSSSGDSVPAIAQWTGVKWSALAGGLSVIPSLFVPQPRVLTLKEMANEFGLPSTLLVGGVFTFAGGNAANSIAQWDGSQWTTLGTGLTIPPDITPASVSAIATLDLGAGPAVYAAGNFAAAGGTPAGGLARWNGQWTPIEGAPWLISSLAGFVGAGGPALIAGGTFGGMGDSFLAKWGCSASSAALVSPQAPTSSRFSMLAGPIPGQAVAGVKLAGAIRRIGKGEVLALGYRTLVESRLHVANGGTLRLDDPDGRLVVGQLLFEPGATLEWTAGTIEVQGGTFTSPSVLAIGCEGSARLILQDGAQVDVPALRICPLGELLGEGVVTSGLANDGLVLPSGAGIVVLGDFEQGPLGSLRIDLKEIELDLDRRRGERPALWIQGHGTLAGELVLAAEEGWIAPRSTLPVLEATAISGSFVQSTLGQFPVELSILELAIPGSTRVLAKLLP